MQAQPQATIAAEVRRHREGDSVATEAIARHATRLALRTAAAIMRSREEASDVAQDVAVDVLRSLHKLREPAAFDAWAHRITARHVQRHLRRRRGRSRAETPLALVAEAAEPAEPGVDWAGEIAVRQALAAALAELPPKQRIALALRYVHDLPDAEIAAALGCSTGNVHSLLSRGRSALRADLRLAEFSPALQKG